MKYIITITLVSLFAFSATSFSQKIYQWEEEGVDNYSNNPAEWPYEKLHDGDKSRKIPNVSEEQAVANLSQTLEGPSKEKLMLILQAETMLEEIITVKKSELTSLKKQKDAPVRKVVELENYIFKAEHNLKKIRDEKTTFIKQNTNS